MLLAVLMTICATTAGHGNACDVRVKYLHETKTELGCVSEANTILNQLVKDMQQRDPSFYLLSKSADCHSLERIKPLLNAIPEVMQDQGFTYRLSFY